MKKNTEKIDELIKEALTTEEAAFYDDLEEPNIIGKLEGIYKGKMGWLTMLITIIQILFVFFFVVCAMEFFDAEETNELIKWAVGAFFFLMAASMLKMFVWMQMDKNDILREIKRLELQMAALLGKSHH